MGTVVHNFGLKLYSTFQVGCCGADGSDDFINAMKPVPYECRDQISGNEYGFGCQQQLAWWLEPWSAFFAATMVNPNNYFRLHVSLSVHPRVGHT